MDTKKWTVVGAASILGLGILGGGAVATANTLQLNDVFGGDAGVDRISTDVPRSIGSAVTPGANSTVSAISAHSAASAVSANSPASADSAPSPVSPVSANSPVSPDSPASPVSADSPNSPDSPNSAD